MGELSQSAKSRLVLQSMAALRSAEPRELGVGHQEVSELAQLLQSTAPRQSELDLRPEPYVWSVASVEDNSSSGDSRRSRQATVASPEREQLPATSEEATTSLPLMLPKGLPAILPSAHWRFGRRHPEPSEDSRGPCAPPARTSSGVMGPLLPSMVRPSSRRPS